MSVAMQESVETEVISVVRQYFSEAIGTFVLVFVGMGSVVVAVDGVNYEGAAITFGFVLIALIYSLGAVSGCHINPAVTLAFLVLGRIRAAKAAGYVVAQLIGGLVAGVALRAMKGALPGYDRSQGLAANGWGAHSPSAVVEAGVVIQNGYGLGAVILVEVVLTALLVFTVLAVTDRIAHHAFAGIAVGAVLVALIMVSAPIDGTSFNPARSVAVAPYQDGAWGQLWAFIVFPLIGAVIGALAYSVMFGNETNKMVNV